MTFYCYSTDERPPTIVDLPFPPGAAPQTVTLDDGRIAHRDYAAEHRAAPKGTRIPRKRYPYVDYCEQAVNPASLEEVRSYLGQRGCRADYRRDGSVLIESPGQLSRMRRLRGFEE
jgi:hypothetical protein